MEETKVPLSNIRLVYDKVMISPRPIFVEFNKETAFGKKIMFIGTTELFLFYSTHPSVIEIRKKAKL